MQQMNPFIGVGLRQAKELTLHRLSRILFEVQQDKQQFVFARWEGTIAIGRIGTPNTIVPLNRLASERVRKTGCEEWDEMLKLSTGQAREGDKLWLILGKVFVPKHTTSL